MPGLWDVPLAEVLLILNLLLLGEVEDATDHLHLETQEVIRCLHVVQECGLHGFTWAQRRFVLPDEVSSRFQSNMML